MSEVDGGDVPLLNDQTGTAADNNQNTGESGPSINNNTMNVTRNNNNLNSLLNVRDRLHHALFMKAALAYARIFPRPVRRFIEFMVLLKAISTFFVLAYVHIVFSRTPTNCLEHIRDEWPRDGILRVEILRNGGEDYSIEKSYAKEERLRQEKVDDLTSALGLLARDGFINIEPSAVDDEQETIGTFNEGNNENLILPQKEIATQSTTVSGDTQESDISTINTSISPSISSQLWNDPNVDEKGTSDETVTPMLNIDGIEGVNSNGNDSSDASKDKNSEADKSVSAEDSYIVEYSLEYGFLRLSPLARQKLNIPVKIVTLDPLNDKCFGDGFSRIILDKFLGYNDILMASIKTLAQHEDNKGFFRNVVTGEQYRFVSVWMGKTSYLAAFFSMLAFTTLISMLLCYTHHQIFVFVVEFVQMLEFNSTVSLPAALVMIMLLALIGMETIMTDFFNDYKTAFYVILTVWMANQYNAICCHTPIAKRHWLRFFYLYHFLFYAYYYRFNGQHSRLALATSLLFIFHSMLYFFHHYELPAILQQAQIQRLLFQDHRYQHHQHQRHQHPYEAPYVSRPIMDMSNAPQSTSASSQASTPSTEQTQQNYIAELSQLDPDPNNPDEQPETTLRTTVERQNNEESTKPSSTEAAAPVSTTNASSTVEGFEVIDAADETKRQASVSAEEATQ